MTAYVLTRTSNRPRMFARLRQDLLAQTYPGRVVHVVHSDDPTDAYVEGDVIVRSERLERSKRATFPWDAYHQRLLETVASLVRGTPTSDATHEPGWVTFMDDDDTYTSSKSLERMLAAAAHPGVMPVWRVERENGRISPTAWQGDLATDDGRICWEGAAHHTSHIGKATIDGNDGADGRYWHQMSEGLELVWRNETLARPQAGTKGHGRRRDA